MKNSIFTLFILAMTTSLPAQNDFSKEQSFNRGRNPLPYRGLDILRKDNPYIVIRNISNSTNGRQFNKEKYVTLPHISQANLFSVLGFYQYDSLEQEWAISEVGNYYIGYDFDLHAVPYAYTHRLFGDSTKNTRSMTTFTFKGISMPDTQLLYEIGEDTILVARNVFTHDAHGKPERISFRQLQGYGMETIFGYDSANRLVSELNLYMQSQFATVDSLSRYTYTYDSVGNVLSYQEEKYNLPGRENAWTVTQLETFSWNAKNKLTGDRKYVADASFQLQLKHIHLYSYNSLDQIETYIHMKHENGNYVDRHKLVIFYDGNTAKYGYEYPWEDMDYSHKASRYYVFSSEDILSVDPALSFKAAPLYPNPAYDRIVVPGQSADMEISIFSMDGRYVRSVITGSGGEADVSGLAPGTYFLQAGRNTPSLFVKG